MIGESVDCRPPSSFMCTDLDPSIVSRSPLNGGRLLIAIAIAAIATKSQLLLLGGWLG